MSVTLSPEAIEKVGLNYIDDGRGYHNVPNAHGLCKNKNSVVGQAGNKRVILSPLFFSSQARKSFMQFDKDGTWKYSAGMLLPPT